jgi:tetratricopeptide (TPR) repeat protein
MELDELTRGDVVPREIHLHRTLSYLYDYWLPPVEMREGALAAIESCIESDGATAGNLSLLGNVRSLRGEHGAAQAAIEFSSVPQPDRYMVAFMHSFALLGMGRTEESICRAEESLALVPHHQVSFHVWQLLGRGHALRGDWDSAIRCAERSRMLKPTFPEACFDLALSYAYSGQKQRGQQVLADLGRHMNVKMLCATRPARGQAWEGWQRDGLARLGVGAL